jgi:hypothetical protein
MSQILGYKQGVIFAGDAMLELAPREGMKRAKEWRPYKRLTVPAPDLFSRDIVKLDNATAFVHEPKPIGSAKDKPDFDLLILDETDPLSMLAGFDVPPVSLTREAYEAIMATFKDPSDQEIVSGFLTLFQEACSDAGVGGFLPPLKPGEYYHDLGQDQLSGLNLDEEIGIFRSEFITGDYIEMLETVREIAFENLPKPVNQNAFIKLTAKQIIEANAVTIKARSLLLGVARVCEVMCLGLRNDLSILRHLKVSTTAGSILLRRKKTLGHHYSRLPTMIFDATLRPELLQQTFERLEIAYQQYATDSGGVLRYQLRDRDLSYGTLEGADWLPRLWLFSRLCNRMHGPTGLITPKSIRDQLPEDAHAGVRLGHFGALRGLNAFENVAALVVASRTAVAPGQAEDMAAVLSGQNISALPAEETWYPAKKGLIRWRQDPRAGWSTKYVEHPDPMVESVRAAITEDGLEQALGRGRNVRRSRGRPLVEYIITTTPTNRPVDGTFSMTELKAATGWIGAFLELGVWFKGGTKGVGGVLHTIARALAAQRPDSLYISLIGNPAFEGPETASDWRKKQIDDNPEISRLSNEIDKALGSRGKSVEVMCSLYPLHDFAPVEAKVKGSRYFAQLYVRIGEGQTAIDAMNALLGPLVGELEIRPAPMA